MTEIYFSSSMNDVGDNDIYRHVEVKKTDHEICFEGVEYLGTKEYSPKQLQVFVERDVFLFQKGRGGPQFKMKWKVYRKGPNDYINILVYDFDSRGCIDLQNCFQHISERYISQKIGQFLWKYNYEVINKRGVILKKRFCYTIGFHAPTRPSEELKLVA